MSRDRFYAFVLEDLLPEFCRHYGYGTAGFDSATLNRISDYDASWFLRALETQVVVRDRAFFYSALSGAKEQIFWQGKKSAVPRSVTIWAEPVITIGAAGRLHKEYAWPRSAIGLQSKKNWAFDLVAYSHAEEPLVVCEVKKTCREVDNLILDMQTYIEQSPLAEEPVQPRLKNSYRKVVGLREMKPKYCWILGPENYGKIFRISSSVGKYIAGLEEFSEASLGYKNIHADT